VGGWRILLLVPAVRVEEVYSMGGKIGITEIVIIVAIALLLFGPSKFASLGKGLGEGIRNFKSSMKEEDGEKKDEEEKHS